MKKLSSIVIAAALLGLASVAGAEGPAPGARVLSLDECIAIALSDNVDSRASNAEVAATEAVHDGSRADLLPKLRADGAVQQWNSPFKLPFAIPGAPGPAPELTVRDAFTWTASATLVQPLTGLFTGIERNKANALASDSARLSRDTARRDVTFRVAEQYIGLLEAKRLVDVAHASVISLDAQRKKAASLLENGVLAKNDLLRAELAFSNAKQREIRARGSVIVAQGRLAALLGFPAGASIDAAPIRIEVPPREAGTVTVASAEARSSRRIELRESDARIEQAAAGVRAARGRLLPQIHVVGNYTHFEGSAFQQKNAAYAGLVGSWDVWDWGSTLSASREAEARREQAKLARVRVEEQARLDARKAAVEAAVAREALEVAQAAVEQAEENYRIASRRFEEAEGTTFDMVDAESLLTESRAQVETATYGWLLAQLAVQRATGEERPRLR